MKDSSLSETAVEDSLDELIGTSSNFVTRTPSDIPDKLINPGSLEGKSGISGISDAPDAQFPVAEDFPFETMPSIALEFVEGFSRMTRGQMSPAIPGLCCLGVISAAIGPYLRIRSTANGDTTGANVYILAAAESSSGKSLPFGRITKPLFEAGTELNSDFLSKQLPHLKSEEAQLKVKKDVILKNVRTGGNTAEGSADLPGIEKRLLEIQQQMAGPRLYCNDATSQAIIRLMAGQRGTCLSSLSDDARGVVEIIEGKYNSSNVDDSFYINAWTCSPYSYDRAGGSVGLVIDRPWLSALWFIQPDKLRSLASKSETFESGFFQRLLISDTGATPLFFTDEKNCFPESVEKAWAALVNVLIKNHRRKDDDKTLVVEPSEAAERYLRSFHNECVELQMTKFSDIPTITGKWGENAWRIALIFHAADHPENCVEVPLSIETAERAVKLMRWFAAEALRAVAPGREEKEDARMNKLAEILRRPKFPDNQATQGELTNNHGFKARELQVICEKYPTVFEKIERPTTQQGGKPTFIVKLRSK